MDKKVVFAVAGSGKTSLIINNLNLEERALLITYTLNNLRNIRLRIIEKFGHFPDNIKLYSYFTFLYSFCYRPFLADIIRAKGINLYSKLPRYLKLRNQAYYLDSNCRLYHARIAKLLEVKGVLEDIAIRLEKYYDKMLIDEVQDIAGHDFNLLKSIAKANIEMLFVGDFYQHTFDTSRDGSVNKNLHSDIVEYKKQFDKMGFVEDNKSLIKSYRCSPSLCNFITENVGIAMESHKTDVTEIIRIDNEEKADEIYYNHNIVKLFYMEHHRYGCFSCNWGDSKGENNYKDICVVLNKTTLENFENGNIDRLKPQTKNKFYVACSRANNDLFFVSDEFYKKYKRKKH